MLYCCRLRPSEIRDRVMKRSMDLLTFWVTCYYSVDFIVMATVIETLINFLHEEVNTSPFLRFCYSHNCQHISSWISLLLQGCGFQDFWTFTEYRSWCNVCQYYNRLRRSIYQNVRRYSNYSMNMRMIKVRTQALWTRCRIMMTYHS